MSLFDKIKQFQVDDKAYIVAEVGSNYRDYNDLINSVRFAKQVGADAVKFQYFSESELYGPEIKLNPENFLPQLRAKADAVGIDLLCSTFSPLGMAEVDPFVDGHKIASSEMSHVRLLEKVKETDKTVIISTGAYHKSDIKRVVDFMKYDPADPMPGNTKLSPKMVLLHCNVKYPARFSDMQKFRDLHTVWSGPIGFSDHSLSIDVVPLAFKNAGAVVIEKHFNPFGLTDTPDAPHSLGMDEFKAMVETLRGAPSTYTEENDARLLHVRRVVATKDIAVGEVISEGVNMGIFRVKKPDAKGVNPFNIGSIEGRKAARAIAQGEGISILDVEKKP